MLGTLAEDPDPFPEPTSDDLQPSVTLIPENMMSYSGLLGTCPYVHITPTRTHIYAHNFKIKYVFKRKNEIQLCSW